MEVLYGLLLPFLGTALGAGCVFFMKNRMNPALQRGLTGFAAGVMTAATVWSLLIPAMEQSDGLGIFAFLPGVGGLWLGFGFLLLLDRLMPQKIDSAEASNNQRKRSGKLVLAVTLHNLPEGMAIGVVLAGWLRGEPGITGAMVTALAVGIALQNFPEGSIISMPLRGEGVKKSKAFFIGVLSGIVEPVGAAVTLLAAGLITPALPTLLSFAAGAMLFVVVEELVPEMMGDHRPHLGTVFFALGFSVMMALDVALG
ncbi:MAG: ZIP family metal transporter [Clostridia bacterium]|nr:ZIP family metal transporter [Clostridia bacterium]MBQ1965293.1 ZIP family metal transporter [Clostridia bacterium]